MKNQFIFFPKKSASGYFDKSLNRHFSDKTEKREYMNTHNIVEHPSMESEKHRTNRLCDQINYDREKRGLKPVTKSKLMGDAR
jgi:hypothetical protein